MRDSFTMDVPLGPYAVDFLNIPRTISAERLLEVLSDLNVNPQGFRDVTKGRSSRAPIFRVGFLDKQIRHEAVLTLSGQIIPELFRAPLWVSLARDIPRGHCFACGQKGHSAQEREKCTPSCRICLEPMVIVEDGESFDHQCVYIQEDYDPALFKQQFQSRSRPSLSSVPSPVSRSRPSYFTSPQGRLPQAHQPSPVQSRDSPPQDMQQQQGVESASVAAPQLTFEQFQQQQLQLQQQQYQAYLQQQQ